MSPSLQTMGFFMSDINFCNTKEQLNHLGEVVTGKVNGSPTGADIDTSALPYTGQVRKTLPALEGEYEQSITDKESEADAVIDTYRLLNKGPYASGITLESKFEFTTYNGESYFATNPPYTTTATLPDADGNLFISGYITEQRTNAIAIARSLNVEESQVIYSTDTTTVLDDVLYIYDASAQTTWVKPSDVGSGETIVSVVGDVLTTSGGSYELYTVISSSLDKRYVISFYTLFHLINGDSGGGETVDFSALASVKSIVKTEFNNLHVLNESPDGGALYQILTTSDYGGTPDGEIVGGVRAGADHYVGGGTDYVAKYMPEGGVIDAEALGYYSGQNTGTGDLYEDATAVFNKVLDYAQERPIKLQAKQNYYYAGSYGSLVAGVKRHIDIVGSGMPVLDRNPNAPWEYNRLIGGTRIRGYMSLLCTSASLREFGVDGAPEATDNWPYTWDALGVKTYDTARSNSCYLDKIIALGKSYDTPSHALIISGFNNTIVTDCQGYSTWYGLSVDMKSAVITNFIGGNNERNLVNLKSHQDTGTQGDRFNNTCSVTGVAGLNPTTQSGDRFGTACIAIEADGTNLERVVVSDVASSGFTGSIDVTPFNGSVMTNVMISNVTGSNSSDSADLIPDIRVWAASGGGGVQNLHLSNIQLQNVSYQAMKVEDVTFFSCDNFFANTGTGGVGTAPTLNTNFVEIDSSVTSASLDGFTLVNSFGLTAGTGQGALQWNNTAANNRKGGRMLCINLGAGVPS